MTTPDQPCHLAGLHPADCPAYVAGIATLRERLTTAPIRLTPDDHDRFAGEAMTDPAVRAAYHRAAYERGVAEGRRQATDGIEDLRRPFFHTEPANGVTLAVTYQGADGLAFVAQPRRAASEPYEQYGVVLPRDVARTLALRMLASVGPWEPAEQGGGDRGQS